MEHSTLQVLLLTGLLVALGGPITALWLILPASRFMGKDVDHDAFTAGMLESVARWVIYAALAAAAATLLDFVVQVAELKGETVFGGAQFSEIVRFVTQTIVGRLCLARAVFLILTACATLIPGRLKWWLVAALAWSAVIANSFVSHAAAQPGNQTVAIAAQIAHVTAAALWMGVLLQLFVARRYMFADAGRERVAFIAEMVRRFSPVALAMTSLLGITGVIAAYRYLNTVGAILTSPYGLTLLVKLALLTPAIYAGYVNFRFIRPRLIEAAGGQNSSPPAISSLLSWFSKTLELEITAGLLVIAAAGILASVSPPGPDGSQRLTDVQTSALLTPHLPNTDIRGWDLPDDPRGYLDKDMRWAMFTHNWSGVAICLMALGWIAQSMRGQTGVWGARLSPLLIIPFGFFISFIGNPELWVMHHINRWSALTDPAIMEHQLGGSMLFLIAWLTWRDRKNPEEKRPLGYPLAIIIIIGSLLLLGHAHSVTTVSDELSNLINVQHAVFGACGIFAGTIRLLLLRGLIPKPVARYAVFVWPCFILAWGLFMAFFYREMAMA